jgi:cell division septum initiation protein DivIVA
MTQETPQPTSASSPPPTPTDAAEGEGKLVPVAESIKYRRRAQQAEGRLHELEQQLTELHSQLDRRNEELAVAEAQRDEARVQLVAAGSQRTAERLLAEAGVVDFEAAGLLLAQRMDLSSELDDETIRRGVEQLLLDKPFLVRPSAPLPPATAAPRAERPGSFAQLTQAAERAVQTGSRRDVAEYLRLRRQGAVAIERPGAKPACR